MGVLACMAFARKEMFFGTTECFAEGVGQTHPKHREIGWSLYFSLKWTTRLLAVCWQSKRGCESQRSLHFGQVSFISELIKRQLKSSLSKMWPKSFWYKLVGFQNKSRNLDEFAINLSHLTYTLSELNNTIMVTFFTFPFWGNGDKECNALWFMLFKSLFQHIHRSDTLESKSIFYQKSTVFRDLYVGGREVSNWLLTNNNSVMVVDS